jgi:hypothetical protein
VQPQSTVNNRTRRNGSSLFHRVLSHLSLSRTIRVRRETVPSKRGGFGTSPATRVHAIPVGDSAGSKGTSKCWILMCNDLHDVVQRPSVS